MSEEITRSRKLVLKRIASIKEGGSKKIYKDETIQEVFSSAKSLSNSLRKMAKADLLDRERDGQSYSYKLSNKGKKRLQEINKRERERKVEEKDLFNYEDGVNEFVNYFENDAYGYEQVKKAGIGRRYVYLDYELLEKFNVELADDLITDPDNVLQAAREAVNSLPELTEDVDVRIKNISEIEVQSISELSAKDLNRLVSVEGVIQSVSRPGSIIETAIFECVDCGDRYERAQDGDKLKSPYKCECGSRKFNCINENHNTVRYVSIKEKPNRRSRNKTVAILKGELAEDETKNLEAIGSAVKVTGYLDPYKKSKRDDHYNFRLVCNNIEIEETKWDIVDLTPEEIEKIKEISDRDDVFDYLSRSLAYEQIKNEDLMKKSFLMWLVGRTQDFGNLHVLNIGDPGTAKSHLGTIISDKFGKVVKAVATGATEVGLTASVVKDEVTGEFSAEGGSLPMADGGFHITDEIDELKNEYYSAFNEALSDGKISLAKADIQTEINADVSEYSVGNPKNYSFDPMEEKYKQIPISKDDLISRYGLILATTNNDSSDEDSLQDEREKIRHIMNRGDSENFEEDDYLEEDLLRKYIYYAQRSYPVLNEPAKKAIEDVYMSLFESQDSDQNFVKPRHANALTILSIGFARLELSNEVTEKHVRKASEFFSRCYRSIDFEIGKDDFSEIEGQNTKRLRTIRDFFQAEERIEFEYNELEDEFEFDEDDLQKSLDILSREGEIAIRGNEVIVL